MVADKAEVVNLVAGAYRAEINTLGAGLKSLLFGTAPLVETYDSLEEPPLACGLLLAPWPNRTEDGKFNFGGKEHQLAITEPERNNAIHGFVHTKVWDVLKRNEHEVLLGTKVNPTEGWPWEITLNAMYTLSPEGLQLEVEVHTEADSAPFALGWHTYLNARGAKTDASRLRVNVEKQLPLNGRNLPCGPLESTELSGRLHQGTALAGLVMDDCFKAEQGLDAVVESDAGAVRMRCSQNLQWAQIFTPDESLGVTYPGRGRALAVEPMSAPPNALHDGVDVEKLRKGDSVKYWITISAA